MAAVDGPATKLCKFLASTFTPLLNNIPAHINSTSSFLEALNSVSNPSYSFASLDVVDLYGSIPIQDNTFPGVLTIVTDFFERNKRDTALRDLHRDDFNALLHLCLTSDSMKSGNNTFKQRDGIQMEKQLLLCLCCNIHELY